jgi:hypothetical protein
MRRIINIDFDNLTPALPWYAGSGSGGGGSEYIDAMKYTQTVNLTGGISNDITTLIPSSAVIYNVELIDSTGNIITTGMGQPLLTLSGGFYHVNIYSTDDLVGVRLRILY